ncbi:ribbon-helix-helix CopG family protein [Kribbella sp. VKM Ac-2569]|uniref:ribbon-helix-helix protein, CopG family n=1 Tax=Kribbella sp. VKM Ac-2569 TaxID=2512220 RepID=UPI00102C7F75|nr:ribbon-helix-helix protein, CopG family [Kribbella sp. VKM Ac-2569]RZT12770.1 ribbon-helix-helix CopG family protein [Kribbella sp. VKM Ac-2569]
MAMNLRLPSEVATALQAEAERTGQSQQQIVRDALGRRLHLIDDEDPAGERERARAAQAVQPARVPYRKVRPRLRLPKGTTSLDLLGRDDRF